MSVQSVAFDQLATLTATPGVGGVIKQRPDDFLVEEQPLYEPSGSGEHLYLCVQKRGLATVEAARRFAQAFGVKPGHISYAGLKDKFAVTRQLLSVHLPKADPAREADAIAHASSDQLQVLWAARHGNKLRRGHHAGNRFVIRIRQVEPTAVVAAKRTLDELTRRGIPNYLGSQRFGYLGNNHLLGRLLLKGDHAGLLNLMLGSADLITHDATRPARQAYDQGDFAEALRRWPNSLRHEQQALRVLARGGNPQRAVSAMDEVQREFLLSALQSAVFNQVLHQRLRDGTFDRLLPGDLAWKHDSRAVFAVDDATAQLENQPDGRVAKLDVSPSGPMWGAKMTRAAGVVDELELAALQTLELTPDDFAHQHGLAAAGVRRPLRVFLRHPELSAGVDEHGAYIRVAFELERGAFATVVLRELMKCQVSDEGSSGDD